MAVVKHDRLPAGNPCETARVAAAVFLSLAVSVSMIRAAAEEETDTEEGLVPLVKVNLDLSDLLQSAAMRIKKEDYTEAIRILQAMIDSPKKGFCRIGDDPRRFLPARKAAVDMLGTMGKEGIEEYRVRYSAKAARKYRDAVESGRIRDMDAVAESYRYTEYGNKALRWLAAAQFDRGLFAQAADSWDMLSGDATGPDKPYFIALCAVASHLAGDTVRARERADRLKRQYPKSRAPIGGTDRNLSGFVKTILETRPEKAERIFTVAHEFPGYGGLEGRQVRMADAGELILRPVWRVPYGLDEEPDTLVDTSILSRIAGRGFELEDNGMVSFEARAENSAAPGQVACLPPCLRPVVVGEQVIYRDENNIFSVDVHTGRKLWSGFHLPLVSPAVPDANANGHMLFRRRMIMRHVRGGAVNISISRGLYGLTAGGGKVFALYGFTPARVNVRRGFRVRMGFVEGASSLVALRVSDQQGKRCWLPDWEDDDAFLDDALFVSLPAYRSAGPGGPCLYVPVTLDQNYYLVCLDDLDSRRPRVRWKTLVAHVDSGDARRVAAQAGGFGFPPLLHANRVFVLNNAGVVAALDADSGRPVWACQYERSSAFSDLLVDGKAGRSSGIVSNANVMLSQVNPLIVTKGRLIVMPADSNKVMAFSVTDGRAFPSADRGGYWYLAAVDEDAILLAGRGLKVLSAADLTDAVKEVSSSTLPPAAGRPAVCSSAVLYSGDGKLFRVPLEKGTQPAVVSRAGNGALLGNLLSLDGMLLASNAMGICAYKDYDRWLEIITARLEDTAGLDRAALLYKRSVIAFYGERYRRAAADLVAAAKLAGAGGNAGRPLSLKISHLLLKSRVKLANEAIARGDREEALKLFRAARDVALTRREKAYMSIRLMKYYERYGLWARAIETAEKLAGAFAGETLYDIRIGKRALAPDEIQQGEAKNEPVPVEELAGTFIQRLIRVHGRKVYESFDKRAKKALDEALAAEDPEAARAVADRFSHSVWAGEALTRSLELYCLKAAAASGENRTHYRNRAIEIMNRDFAADPSDPCFVPVAVARLSCFGIEGRRRSLFEELAVTDPATTVSFADVRGTLGRLLEEIAAGNIRLFAPTPAAASIRPPLEQVRVMGGAADRLGVGNDFRPAVFAGRLAVLTGDCLRLMAAGDPQPLDGAVPLATVPAGGAVIPRVWFSRDGKSVTFCSTRSAAGIDVDAEEGGGGWQIDPARLGFASFTPVGGDDEHLVVTGRTGAVVAVSGGRTKWSSRLEHFSGGSSQHRPWNPGFTSDSGPAAQVFNYGGGKRTAVLDMTSGKILLLAGGRQSAESVRIPGWGTASMVDGELSLYRKGTGSVNGSSGRYHLGGTARLLGASCRSVAACEPQEGANIVLCPVRPAGSDRRMTVRVDGGRPAGACFAGDRLFVVTGRLRAPYYTAFSTGNAAVAGAVGFCCFDPHTGRRLWRVRFDGASADGRVVFLPVLNDGTVVLSVVSVAEKGGTMHRAMLIDAETGEVRQEIAVASSTVAPAAVAGGRVFIDTGKGIAVFQPVVNEEK